jgi:hypothetical protein
MSVKSSEGQYLVVLTSENSDSDGSEFASVYCSAASRPHDRADERDTRHRPAIPFKPVAIAR